MRPTSHSGHVTSRLAVAVAAVLAASPASAASLFWGSGGTNNAWTNSAFWFLDADETTAGAVPTITDDVIFNTTPDNALGGSVTMGTDIAAKSLTFNTSGNTLLAQSGTRIFTLGSGGITVNAGAGNATVGVSTNTLSVQASANQLWTNNATSTLNVRSLRASNTAPGPVEITLNAANSGPISFSLGISDSPDAAKALSILVDSAGSGSVNFVGSSFTGGTTIKRGAASSNGTLGLGGVSLGVVAGAEDARLNLTGAATNNITVQSGAGLRTLSGSGSGNFQGSILLNKDVELGSFSSGSTVAYSGGISGIGNITIKRLGTATNSAITISGPNTYTGKTTIESATVAVDLLANVGSNSSLGAPTTVESGTISMGAGADSTLRYTGTGASTDRLIEIVASRTITLEQAGTGLLNFTSGVTNSGTGSRTLRVRGATAGTGEISGEITNIGGGFTTSLSKLDSGTWRLSAMNNYTGVTSLGASGIAGGVLEVLHLADGGMPSSIGASSAVASNLSFGGVTAAATLRYLGTGGSTNRSFIIGGIGAVLDASGTGAISFTSTSNTAYGTSNTATSLTLTGTNAGANTYAANQSNNGTGNVSLIKEGTGTWILSGNSLYSGATTVNDGHLLVSGSLSGTTATTVNTGGTFGGTGLIQGPTTVNAGGSLLGGDGASVGEDLSLSGDVTLGDGSFIKLTLGAAGAHSTLAQAGGTWSFDLDQAFTFIDIGATATTYDNIITGLTSDPNVAAWTITNPGFTGTFAYDSGTVDLTLTAIPEPSTLLGLAVGTGLLLGFRRRRV